METERFDPIVRKKNFNEGKTTNRKVCTVPGTKQKKAESNVGQGYLYTRVQGGIKAGSEGQIRKERAINNIIISAAKSEQQ